MLLLLAVPQQKKPEDILNEDYGIQPFAAYCISHGLSSCSKKGKMTVGKFATQHMTGMVKFSLCKSKTAFHAIFGEAAKKESGVCWCQKFEQYEQVNHIPLIRLRDEWDKSSIKFVESIEKMMDLCIASVEIAASVDVGRDVHSLLRCTWVR